MIGTLDELKAYLGEETSKADDRLTSALQAATSIVNAYCRRPSFESATYSNELYDGSGNDVLILQNFPVTAVTSLLEFGVALSTGLDPTTNPDVLIYGEQGLLIRPSGCFVRLRRWYKVTYTAGYLAPDMPPIVKQAALDAAALIIREKDRIGLNNKTVGQQQTSYIRQLPKHVQDGLDYYRDLSLARRVAA